MSDVDPTASQASARHTGTELRPGRSRADSPTPSTRSATSDPSTRGTLVIAERAIEKVASNAASTVPGVSGPTGGFLGLGARHKETARPKADVQLNGLIASLRLEVGITYPAPLKQTTELLRATVRDDVSRICGLDVRQVDIDINTLLDPTRGQGRRELA
ncbi:Asp23/Gls24 family envelope stress response protein [Arthrobacter sp. L77]|uniref:Asp23/Gls24 family envelope stress response protein n=1 Tax=Arthrobacter sp. L77 TaxID=1496689 RepID=UPI00068D4F59|nr:Asp23/Gls24 family envelope stress response protein [Arthrobacter sp. L77]